MIISLIKVFALKGSHLVSRKTPPSVAGDVMSFLFPFNSPAHEISPVNE